ncbi:hypothetical protein Hypma_003582 [Hypsizygus marmoreus]|uniref:DUF4470 domain-containing protein n=1 Tax=Hypsizygus marmoreus TaxID=39966 RepID=A0A369J8E7_HYPMA|nr:hypothetical protein Hypma_003582 [Hypsizygus marmoreus]
MDCEHPVLEAGWQPAWVQEGREPAFEKALNQPPESRTHRSVIPAANCLQLAYNEGDARNRDFKLCFAASGDIRNLVKTVNGLPKGYRGKCDILLNDTDAITVNRNLVILYALLSAGPTIEESAELATHLMYSAALPAASAAYLRGCICVIYGDGASDGDMSFQSSLRTRGAGRIHSMQTTIAMRRPLEMFLSTYELRKGIDSMQSVMFDPLREDNRDRYLTGLKPAHRLAVMHYWRSGILAPFSLEIKDFSQPNRLMFTANGGWLGHAGANPLHGWDVSDVRASGAKHGIDSADIFGCLFFHVKRELMEFARRMKEFHVDIHLTQFDSQVLSKGISIGVLPRFAEACFDRIETSNLVDERGVKDSLNNWGPLLNRNNEHACIIMHSRDWHLSQPKATAQSNPRAVEILIERCSHVPALELRLRHAFTQGAKSPAVMRLIQSLDAFIDHEEAFQEYLRSQHAGETAERLGLRLRGFNRINSKRFGVPMDAPKQKLPDLTRDAFYDIFTIGGADFPIRFVEFEGIS